MDLATNTTNRRLSGRAFVNMYFRYLVEGVFMGAACNGVIHGIAMIIAMVNLWAHKLARVYLPVLMLGMGLLSTFTVLLLSSFIIALIFDSMALPFNQLHAFACGFLCSTILFIFSIIRFPATL